MPADLTSVERLAEMRKSWPDAVKLAELLALAARIEPELLREVRLALFPKSHASLEAEFYFSPLVAQRTPQWVVLDTQLAHELQNGLASAMKRRPKAKAEIRHARALIERAHASIPFEIVREEEMIWLSVERPRGKSGAVKSIDAILRDFLARLLAEGEQAGVVARWFASAAARLPLLARQTPAFAMLGFAASSILGGRQVGTAVNPSLQTFEELARYLPRSAKRMTVWTALTTRGLHFVPRKMERYQPVEVPLTNPVLLDVHVEGEASRLTTMQPGQPLFVPLPRTPVQVRTLGRDLLTFRARPRVQEQAAREARQESVQGRRIYVSYDQEDLPFVRRLAGDLTALGHSLSIDPKLIPPPSATDRLRQALDNSDCVLVILSKTAVERPLSTEIRMARSMGIPVIGAAVEPVASKSPWMTVSLNFDFSRTRDYQETLLALQKAILAVQRTAVDLPGVPELPPYYVPRPELLTQLHEAVLSGLTAIVGPPGIGKTVLAAAYARSAEAREAFPAGIAWFESGDYGGAGDIEPEGRLFIFDDVSNPDSVDAVLRSKKGRGRCVITTRDEKVAQTLEARQIISNEDLYAAVRILPLRMGIVLTRKGADSPTFNLDCELQNQGSHGQRISLIQARLTDASGFSFNLRWNVFYETSGTEQRRTQDAGPLDVAPGATQLGIQFVGRTSMHWSEGTFELELTGWLGGAEDGRPPAFSEKRDVLITSREMAEVNRRGRASESKWSDMNDEAIAIPVQLSIHVEGTPSKAGTHPWEFRISAERFIKAYSRYQKIPDPSALHDFIERINEDRDVTDVRSAAFILAVVENETGTFRPAEQRTVRPSAEKVSAQLGNIEPGDSERYRGRGYILIEGRANYRRLSESLHMEKDLIRDPELLLDPNIAYQVLRFVLLQGGLLGKPLAEFINAERTDYSGAYRRVSGSMSSAEQVAKNAETIEEVLRECLIPREPPRSSSVP